MNLEALANRFWEEGYLVLENFFEIPLMDHLNQLIVEKFGDNPDYFHNDEFLTKSKVDVIPWFPKNDGVLDFEEAENNATLVDLTQLILGEGWQHQYSMTMFSKPQSNGQSWHQDCPPENSKHFNLNRLMYTSDVTSENGGMVMIVPGSHKRGLLPVGEPMGDMAGQIQLEAKKGTLVFLHGFTWHRVSSVKDAPRISTNMRAAPVGTPDSITDICVYRNMRYQFSTNEVVEERA